jgi:uncharacterized pyridoxal phosphate-containing UPF0001 family protein
LASTLNKECAKIPERQALPPLDVLVQVLADDAEGSKFGVTPSESKNLVKFIMEECPLLRFRGLMSMGEVCNVEEFRSIHKLRLEMLDEF